MLKSYLLSRKWELIETEKSTPIFCCCKYRQKVIEQISNIVQYWWSMRKAVWTLWQEDRFKSCRKDVLPCRLLRQPTCGGRRRGVRVFRSPAYSRFARYLRWAGWFALVFFYPGFASRGNPPRHRLTIFFHSSSTSISSWTVPFPAFNSWTDFFT